MTEFGNVGALGVRGWGVVVAGAVAALAIWVDAGTTATSSQTDRGAVCLCESEATSPRLPVIVVTRSEIIYEGQLVASVDNERLNQKDSPTFKIDALYERLDARAHKIYGGVPEGSAVTRDDHLVLVEAVEGTDLRLLHKIAATANAAGYEAMLVFADRRTHRTDSHSPAVPPRSL